MQLVVQLEMSLNKLYELFKLYCPQIYVISNWKSFWLFMFENAFNISEKMHRTLFRTLSENIQIQMKIVRG